MKLRTGGIIFLGLFLILLTSITTFNTGCGNSNTPSAPVTVTLLTTATFTSTSVPGSPTATFTNTPTSTYTNTPTSTPTPIIDDFNGPSFNTAFTFVDPLSDVVPSFSSGQMSFTAPAGDVFDPSYNYNAPRLVGTISGNFLAETQVSCNRGTGTPGGVGLVAITGLTSQNFTQFVVLAGGASAIQVNHTVYSVNTFWSSALTLTNYTVWLRLQRTGSVFTSYYSLDGLYWNLLHTEDDTADSIPSSLLVGIMMTDPTGYTYNPATFNYLDIQNQ